MRERDYEVDLCVVGGGMAGVATALAAARQGITVAIIQDRPVFGGNASSEIRVHICGANGINKRETGILEELRLENVRRNPCASFSIWDSILYEKVRFEPNIKYFLNCSVVKAEMNSTAITSVTGWQLTTETWWTIRAKMFADCSGDGILAPLTGAEYRVGREAREEYGESIQPEKADKKTMGMTCLFMARDEGKPIVFERPEWAYEFPTDDDLPKEAHTHLEMGYWWVELGGEQDSIHDTEELRDELLKITYGVWDHIKNKGDHKAVNWSLDWIQFLPGKRESRRYIGDYVLNQNDVEAEGRFDDLVAYGGWSMDDHDTAGFWAFKQERPATIFHHTPSPYGIPYRSLYSRNIDNLFFAGRCASCSHAAMSSTRVMATGMVMGQAAGTAAAMAVKNGIIPRQVGGDMIGALRDSLRYQDCWLPFSRQKYSDITNTATISASSGSVDQLIDGINRPIDNDIHAWEGKPGDWIAFGWDAPQAIGEMTLIVNSALDVDIAMSYHRYAAGVTAGVPDVMVKDIDIEINEGDGWKSFKEIRGNYQRLVRFSVGKTVKGIRATFKATWGADVVRVYGMYMSQSDDR